MTKQYNGLDLLKFVMAFFVIMIHVKPNQHSELMSNIFNPLMSIAVPVFFVVSSFLIFNKLDDKGGYAVLAHYVKRICILYLCWLVLDGWYVVMRMPYFHEGLFFGALHFIKDMVFATTFPGSWYLSASVVGVILVYSISRYTHPFFTFLLSFAIAYYISHYSIFPESIQCPYYWYASHFRKEVSLSFPGSMVWISIGQLLSSAKNWIELNKKWLMPLCLGIFIITYATSIVLIPLYIEPYLMVVSLFVVSFLIELPDNPLYKRIRNYH